LNNKYFNITWTRSSAVADNRVPFRGCTMYL